MSRPPPAYPRGPMTSFFEADQHLRIASWRDATLESVRDELATELGLSFEPREGAYVAASPSGELRLDARPARTCPQQVFVLRTEGEGGSRKPSEALSAYLRSRGHEWYRPWDHEEAWRSDQLDDIFGDRESCALILVPRWLAWLSEDEREEAEGVVYDLSRAWHEAAKRDEAYLWARFAELDAEWCRVPRSERLAVLKAHKARAELQTIGPELDEIEAVLQTGRAARPGTLESLAELRDKLAANLEPAAAPLLQRTEALLASLQSTATVMILAIPADTMDAFERIMLGDRAYESSGWTNYPVRSGRRLSSFLGAATKIDLGAWLAEDREGELDQPVETHVIQAAAVDEVLARLEALFASPESTLPALREHGGNTANPRRLLAALTSETWPTSGDPAEEAAAFARELRDYLQIAQREKIGVCWEFRGPIEPRPPIASSVTILQGPTEGHDEFEALTLDERRRKGGGWVTFPLRSGRRLCTFAMKATGADFGVLGCRDERGRDGENVDTNLIADVDLPGTLADLEALFGTNEAQTIAQLLAHRENQSTTARIETALRTGAWPETGDPAEETAAFAHDLMNAMRAAKGKQLGVCWEYRGEVGV